MTHVTCRLTAKNPDQLRNPTLGSRVWATFTFLVVSVCKVSCHSLRTSIDAACLHSTRSRIYGTVGRPSVRLSVPSIDSSSCGRRVCCSAPASAADRPIESISRCRRRRSAANAGIICHVQLRWTELTEIYGSA